MFEYALLTLISKYKNSNFFFLYRNNNFDVISLNYDETGHLCGKQCTSNQIKHQINQTLWPDHCVMDTNGAAIHVDLIKRLESDLIIRKGSNCEVSC